ncbi:LysR family transcriptional regulator [Gilvimarinus sp. SDUM040013]|uniref:LysR family transcriptional regulator n=1 Tax=Gilvimarinus gilvus TaxID=3058038 RepID=A0ABU4RWT9_9GAMM|nr:LysR family transcriptional regulator [Gilvimarinus sp. SDUM040013]MDO3388471.1 LysR family transcriptional regulator [Gilvimarinus sp. SDUM040013]MDX6848657.1 LysR family transcriptional regulator [Gilvimarinus sp. SDUM040013]
MSSWEGITEFVAVSETGSFTAAAQRLGTSIAHISRRVKEREQRMNTRLLDRTTRKVSLTEEGQVFYQHCRQILDAINTAENALADLQTSPTGILRMTAPVSFGEKYIAPLVNDFALLHPKLRIDLTLSNQRLDLMDEGLDLAVRLGPLEDARLIARRLAERTPRVCASPEYLQRFGTPHTLSELNDHNCLLGTLDYWRFNESGRARSIRVSGSLRCNNGPSLVNAALKGLGLIQLPDYYLSAALRQKQLMAVLQTYTPEREGIWALYPPTRRLSPKVRLLVHHLEMHVPKLLDVSR